MRNKIFTFLIILSAGLLMTSCSNDFLDTQALTEFSQDAVWSDPALVETYINNIYFRLDEPFTNGRLKSNIVDETHYRGNGASKNFNNGIMTSDNIPAWSTDSRNRSWTDLYKSIRYCNTFFANVDKVTFDPSLIDGKSIEDRMKGEGHFLRAYLYQELIAMFGGVPIITEPYELDDDFTIARSSYKDCVDFIVEECDLAASLLPDVQSGDNKGRATRGAALALKSRVLLNAASDLHNIEVFTGFANQELLRYTDDNRKARWEAARDAAKAVIDLHQYGLYKAEPAAGDSVAVNMNELSIADDTEEDIFVKYFTSNSKQMIGLVSGPNGYHNWGTNAPLQDMVDEYEMKDGTKFDWSNPVHAAHPYQNREPRFYADILYEGAVWKGRPADAAVIDPIGIIQVGTWQKWNPATNAMELSYGVDTRKSTIENWNGGYPGYYLRKFQDPEVDAQYFYQTVPWRYIRYAEIILNYAEACIELGQEDEARTYINMIRKRAGMPDITEEGDALRQRYRHERHIEFAFEEQRFFDVRRWVIGADAYKPIHYAEVIYKMNPDHTTATEPTITPKQLEVWSWVDKMYFFPILRTEMNKNSLLIQNPGY